MDNKRIFQETQNGLIVRIKVVPNSSKNDLFMDGERLRLKITAPPVENKANKFVCEFFSKSLKVPKTSIEIISGSLSKEKTLLIPNINEKEFKERFNLKD